MPHSVSLISTIAAGLGLALIFGFLAVRIRLPSLVGYLLAGVVIGPFTPGFVADAAMTSASCAVLAGVLYVWRKAVARAEM